MLQAINITKSYGSLKILKNINISVKKGEIISIVGQSGAGKSTLLNILSTLDLPDTGKIFIDNQDLNSMRDDSLAKFRNQNIGVVFQFHNLLPEFSAIENIAMPAYISGLSKKKSDEKAIDLMKLLDILDCKDHTPSELSGGQAQRVAVARALINKPKIIFADEPSGSLDEKNAEELHSLIFSLRKSLGQTFVISTHNKELAAMADRTLILKDGGF